MTDAQAHLALVGSLAFLAGVIADRAYLLSLRRFRQFRFDQRLKAQSRGHAPGAAAERSVGP